MKMKAEDTIEDWLLLKQSLVVLSVVMVAFVLARPLHLEPATIAMFGAAILMLLDNWAHHSEKAAKNIHQTFSDVEWITIFFFIGLFIVVHGVEVGGLLQLLASKLVAATGGNMAHAGYAILWASAFLSAIVDNIPFVATMIPLIKSMAPAYGGADKIEPLWWCLSLGACLGGNGTLIGASVLAAWMSEILVGAAEGTGEALGMSQTFIGMIIVAIVGGAAESLSAIAAGARNKLDLTMGVVYGSCIQIALFVAPVLVLLSRLIAPEPLDLSFSRTELGVLLLAVLIGGSVGNDGKGNWFKGVQLLTVYATIALLLYFVPA